MESELFDLDSACHIAADFASSKTFLISLRKTLTREKAISLTKIRTDCARVEKELRELNCARMEEKICNISTTAFDFWFLYGEVTEHCRGVEATANAFSDLRDALAGTRVRAHI